MGKAKSHKQFINSDAKGIEFVFISHFKDEKAYLIQSVFKDLKKVKGAI